MADDVIALHRKACEGFGVLVHAVPVDQWSAPTPCSDWDVRALVGHVVGEDLWTPPLLAGRTIADVGDAFDGDLLGTDPVPAWDAALAGALEAAAEPGVAGRTVHLSFGDFPGEEYLRQLLADHLVHGWDLAVATGGDTALDPELVAACADWFAGIEDAYRGAGVVGPRAEVASDADLQSRLLAAFGRRS